MYTEKSKGPSAEPCGRDLIRLLYKLWDVPKVINNQFSSGGVSLKALFNLLMRIYWKLSKNQGGQAGLHACFNKCFGGASLSTETRLSIRQ